MDKITYLAELAEGLARWVPERERRDILRYYAEYFEEAGPDREAEVVAELGDPWALSCRLAVEGGYVTSEQANSWTPPKKKRKFWMLAAGITAAVLLFTVVSIASAASQVGRFVGRLVGGAEQVAYVDEVAEDYAAFAEEFGAGPVVVPGGTFYEVEEDLAGESFWSMEDGCLEAFDEIDVDVSIANVTVTPGNDYTLFINSNTTLGGYSLKWEVKNGVLKIRDGGGLGHVQINSWEDFQNIFGINASAMDVVVTVPEEVALSGAEVKTHLGDVFVSGLVIDKELEVQTGVGDVECYEVHTWSEVSLESGVGDVTLGVTELYSGAEFDLKTGVGTIEAQVDCYEKDWEYEAKTGVGEVIVNGAGKGTKAERKGGSYKLEAESGVGEINLYFQDDRW